jgi:hypothetical protein
MMVRPNKNPIEVVFTAGLKEEPFGICLLPVNPKAEIRTYFFK